MHLCFAVPWFGSRIILACDDERCDWMSSVLRDTNDSARERVKNVRGGSVASHAGLAIWEWLSVDYT